MCARTLIREPDNKGENHAQREYVEEFRLESDGVELAARSRDGSRSAGTNGPACDGRCSRGRRTFLIRPGTGKFPAMKEEVASLPDHVVYRPAQLDKLGADEAGSVRVRQRRMFERRRERTPAPLGSCFARLSGHCIGPAPQRPRRDRAAARDSATRATPAHAGNVAAACHELRGSGRRRSTGP